MKKFFISIVLAVALAMVSPFICFAEKSVSIIYSGNILGYITPVRG